MRQQPKQTNSRACRRVDYRTRAVIATVPSGPDDDYQNDLLLEVETRDMSDSGVRIAGSPLLRVGQNTLLRTGNRAGLVMSSYGRVVRGARGTTSPTQCEWGIEFDSNDAHNLRKHQVLMPMFRKTLDINPEVAVIVSREPLELFWWLGRLAPSVRRVFASTLCPTILKRMQDAAPNREVTALEDPAHRRKRT